MMSPAKLITWSHPVDDNYGISNYHNIMISGSGGGGGGGGGGGESVCVQGIEHQIRDCYNTV
jgi:hypothetical protein